MLGGKRPATEPGSRKRRPRFTGAQGMGAEVDRSPTSQSSCQCSDSRRREASPVANVRCVARIERCETVTTATLCSSGEGRPAVEKEKKSVAVSAISSVPSSAPVMASVVFSCGTRDIHLDRSEELKRKTGARCLVDFMRNDRYNLTKSIEQTAVAQQTVSAC